jgi:hypothetical protein
VDDVPNPVCFLAKAFSEITFIMVINLNLRNAEAELFLDFGRRSSTKFRMFDD